jgi:hypothetical protein
MTRTRSSIRILVLASAALLAASTASPGAAAPAQEPGERAPAVALGTGTAPPAGFASWAEVFAVQDRLNAAAEKIIATRGSGFAGVVAAPENGDVRVYWKGRVPASVRQTAVTAGAPVRFLSAAYSERELLAETARLAADPRVLSVGPEADGSGLTITVTEAGRQAIRSRTGAFGASAIPLFVRTESAPEPLSRQNDFSPYVGGARYTTTGGCSTGFAISLSGVSHILSAGHCGSNGQVAIDGGGNPVTDRMGTIFNDNNARDTLMINTRSFGHIYVGPFNGSATLDVSGAQSDFVGNLVCTSGARTGEHCGLRVTNVNTSDSGFSPLTRAIHPTGGCAAARGDSGGPVVVSSPSGLLARGTISTGRPGEGNVICPNAPVADSSNVVFYAPMFRPVGGPTVGSLQFYGAGIL